MTVVNRFEVKGDTERFEREFRAHSQYLRSREDFDFLVTVQLVDRPDVYVNLGHWRTARGSSPPSTTAPSRSTSDGSVRWSTPRPTRR